MSRYLGDNAFFPSDNTDIYKISRNLNSENVKCLSSHYELQQNTDQLVYPINRETFFDRQKQIRNTDHERPMMFPEYRFKHLNYCHKINIDGYYVCGLCSNCGFDRNKLLRGDNINNQR